MENKLVAVTLNMTEIVASQAIELFKTMHKTLQEAIQVKLPAQKYSIEKEIAALEHSIAIQRFDNMGKLLDQQRLEGCKKFIQGYPEIVAEFSNELDEIERHILTINTAFADTGIILKPLLK